MSLFGHWRAWQQLCERVVSGPSRLCRCTSPRRVRCARQVRGCARARGWTPRGGGAQRCPAQRERATSAAEEPASGSDAGVRGTRTRAKGAAPLQAAAPRAAARRAASTGCGPAGRMWRAAAPLLFAAAGHVHRRGASASCVWLDRGSAQARRRAGRTPPNVAYSVARERHTSAARKRCVLLAGAMSRTAISGEAWHVPGARVAACHRPLRHGVGGPRRALLLFARRGTPVGTASHCWP